MKNLSCFFVSIILLSGCASVPKVTHISNSEQITVQTRSIAIQNTFEPGEIEAKEFLFPYLVKGIRVDSTEMKALVRLRKPEEKSKVPALLVYYDLNMENVIWTVRCNGWNPVFLNDKIIVRTYGNTMALNKNTGDILWERSGRYGLIDAEKGFAVSGSVTAYDLHTGKDIWHRDVKSQFGSDELKLDGESLLASIDGLHSFNISNGSGWYIEMSTGKKDEVATAAKNVGIVLLSATTMALGGGPVTGHAKTNEFSGMTSNILVCGHQIYFAAKENLVCIEKETGNEIWRTTLPEKKSAKSLLIENDEQILFVNKSYCYKNNQFYRYGIPYIAKFDKMTGEQVFTDILDTKDYVKDAEITENGYFLITNKELMLYGLGGKLIAKLDLTEQNKPYGNLLTLLSNDFQYANFFVYENDEFVPLIQYVSSTSHLLVNSENGLLILDSDLDIKEWIPSEKLFDITARGDQNYFLRSTKYYTLKQELADIDFNINSGLTRLTAIKGLKKEYAKIETENQDVLRDLYLVDKNGKTKGKIGISDPVKSTNKYVYYTTDNGLTLISKTSSNL